MRGMDGAATERPVRRLLPWPLQAETAGCTVGRGWGAAGEEENRKAKLTIQRPKSRS